MIPVHSLKYNRKMNPYWFMLVFLNFYAVKANVFGNITTTLYLKSLESLFQTAFGAQEKIGRDIKLDEMKFYLYTSENRGRETLIDPLEPLELFDPNGKIFFLIHSWIDNKLFNHWYNDLTNRLLKRYSNAKIVQVDWSIGSFQEYGMAAYTTESIGSQLAFLISNLVSIHHISIENIVLIGDSMGAHICGWTGKYFTEFTKKRLSRIIALDPANALFNKRPDSKRLSRNDAHVVHVIHTDGSALGILDPCGTIDFYPNGGYKQPGCQEFDLKNPFKLLIDSVFCNHFRSFEYFLEAVRNPGTLFAYKCPNADALISRNCNGDEVALGDFETINEGIFFLETNSKPPFSKTPSKY